MKNLSFISAMLCVAALSVSCCGQPEIETTTVGLSEEIALADGDGTTGSPWKFQPNTPSSKPEMKRE